MKKIYSIIAGLLTTASMFAQAPEKMSYQAVIRNSSNALVVNQSVGMRISILQGSATGTAVYVETQTPTSNANGLVSIEIGGGTIVSGNFSAINWANGPYFVKTETDPTGGTNYSISGTSQLLSVPYALHAKTADNAISQKLTDLEDAHSGGTDFHNSLIIGKTPPYSFIQAPSNTGVGFGIFDSLTTGFNNSAFGFNALKFNTIGNNNVAIGYRALNENNEGSYNVAVGTYALEKNKVLQTGSLGGAGFQNVAIGSWALQNATSHMNVAVGTDVLRNLTTGGQNVGMGEHALRDLITGFGNIAIGYAAMMQVGPNVSANTVIGNKAGENNKGSNNIFVGSGAGYWNTGSGNVFIGLNSGSDSMYHNQNNILLIENSGSVLPLIYGNFQNKSLRINNTLSVASSLGIGITTPQRALHVNDVMRLEPRSTAPINPSKGDMYFDNVINKLRVFDGSIWQNCW